MTIEIESWIPTISALAGAVIGGGFTALATWYSLKTQWKKDIWIKRLDRLGEADKGLFTPFLTHAYRLDAKRDVGDIDDILGVLREGREYFIYCPKDLKQKLLSLYSTLERTNEVKKGDWGDEDIDKFSDEVKQIERIIYKTLTKMEL